MDSVITQWKALTTLWSPLVDEFNGCGYIGTEDNVEPHAFGKAARGCEQYEDKVNLMYLYVSIPIALMIGILICFFCQKRKKVELRNSMREELYKEKEEEQ